MREIIIWLQGWSQTTAHSGKRANNCHWQETRQITSSGETISKSINHGLSITWNYRRASTPHVLQVYNRYNWRAPAWLSDIRYRSYINAQVILRWFLQRQVVPIPKSVTAARIRENIDIFDFVLTQQETQAIDAINQNLRLVLYGKGYVLT